MRKGILVLLVIIAAIGTIGCTKKQRLALPLLNENNVLVTHIKEPTLSVIDLQTNEVIHQEAFEFIIHTIAQIGNDQLVVANRQGSHIVVLDLQANTKRDLHVHVSTVSDMLYDKEQGLLFATEAEKNRVAVIDMEQGVIERTIQVGNYPQKMMLIDHLLYVLNGESASIDVIDLVQFDVVQTFSVVEHPTDVAFVGDTVWVGGHGPYGELNEYVYVYDRASGQLLEKVRAGLMPIAIHYDEENGCLYVLSHGSNELHWIDAQTYSVEGTLTTSDNPFYLTGDKQFIYVTTLDGDQLYVIDRFQRHIVGTIDLQSGPYGIILGGNEK